MDYLAGNVQLVIAIFELNDLNKIRKKKRISFEIRFFYFMIRFSYRFLRRLRTVFLISRSVSVFGCCIDS